LHLGVGISRAEESLGIRELPYAGAFRGRAEESLGTRELSYACGILGRAEESLGFASCRTRLHLGVGISRAEESLGIRELPYAGAFRGRAEESLGTRVLSYACGIWLPSCWASKTRLRFAVSEKPKRKARSEAEIF
jgi:hypothetical protein